MTHARFVATRTFGSLDGLRALSILAVIWHHTASHDFPHSTLASRGYLGVYLFFVISGFLISTLLLREKDSTGDISIRKFFFRRALRIFPLYYAVLLLYTALVFKAERDSLAGHNFWHNLRYFATYCSNWFVPQSDSNGRTIFYFAWSLAVEEQFYLLWPWLEKKARFAFASAAVLALLFIVGGLRLWPFWSILLGVGIAHLFHHPQSYRWTRFLQVRGASFWAFLLVGGMLTQAAVPDPLVIVGFAILVATCVVKEDHSLQGLLSLPPLQHIGQLSYGLYLLHMLSLNVARRVGKDVLVGRPGLLFVSTLLIGLLAANISHRYFERMFLRWKSRYAAIP